MVAYVRVAEAVLKHLPADEASRIEQVGIAAQVDIHLAFSRQHPRAKYFLERFNTGFARIHADGTYRRIERRWR